MDDSHACDDAGYSGQLVDWVMSIYAATQVGGSEPVVVAG